MEQHASINDGPGGTAGQKPLRGGRLTQILEKLAQDRQRERVALADIFAAMGDRAFGALILIFALPNVFPTPPGTSTVLAAPLVFLCTQLMLGLKPWLPGFIARRSLAREDFEKIVGRMVPWLGRGEKLLTQRWTQLVYPPGENIIGLFCLLLSLILILPIPLGNMLPALAICLFSFAILERDGICAIAGGVLFVVSLAVVAGVVLALFKGAITVIGNLFS